MRGCGYRCDYPGVKISIEQGCFTLTYPKNLTCPGSSKELVSIFSVLHFGSCAKHSFLSSKTSAMYE